MSNARGLPGGGGMLKLRFDRFLFTSGVAGLMRRIARIAMARCTREAMFEIVQRHYIKIEVLSFCKRNGERQLGHI